MLGELHHYWSGPFFAASGFVGQNLLGESLPGMLVG
jgi:putative Mg2+ transporter-C (MgtC) family protein